MKTKHAVWIAFFLNLSYAIEFIAGGILAPALVLADSIMTWGYDRYWDLRLFGEYFQS